jgi:triacylglycerol lipase
MFLNSLKILGIQFMLLTSSIYALPLSLTDQNSLNIENLGIEKFKSAQAGEKIPTILVHGFSGFAYVPGILDYWGGFHDSGKPQGSFQGQLVAKTHSPVFVAEVGAFSSNFDRAVELIAQIKGGCVIYGIDHAMQYGHMPYYPANGSPYLYSDLYMSENIFVNYMESLSFQGTTTQGQPFLRYKAEWDGHHNVRCFPGFYPAWDDDHPINLIAHSQGGQTVRYLASLLDDKAFVTWDDKAKVGVPLKFKKDPLVAQYLFCSQEQRKNKVTNCESKVTSKSLHSVMTVSTPHLGTTLATAIQRMSFDGLLIDFIGVMNASLGQSLKDLKVYDFWMDQWGLSENVHDALKQKILGTRNVIRSENPFFTTKDISAYDLSPEGAVTITNMMNSYTTPNTYYFSVATRFNSPNFWDSLWYFTGNIFSPFRDIVSYFSTKDPYLIVDTKKNTWADNDGVVNTVSMIEPSKSFVTLDNYKNEIKKSCSSIYKSKPEFNKWNFVCLLNNFDHMDSVGWMEYDNSNSSYHYMIDFYSKYINYVNQK